MKSYPLLLLLICLYPDLTHAAEATFESFYKESWPPTWILTGAAALTAAIATALIISTGGAAAAATPAVKAIGTWIGGKMGLSGGAALKAGLALLGGSAKASGGLGMAGGTTLLFASLNFGTDMGIGYTLERAMSEYSYNNLAEQSKGLPTLPLPVNDSGPDTYEAAIEILDDVNKELPLSANSNQQLIGQAISRIEKVNKESRSWSEDEKIKNRSFLSLLYFILNDYDKAKDHADTAMRYARTSEIKWTLPAFIYATSSLYEKEFDFPRITDEYFRYSILEEPNNPLIPLLFSIYLDRMLLRFNDDFLNEGVLYQIFTIMESPALKELRVQNYTILLSRYFVRLKLEQQKIMALASTSSSTIKNSPKTLQVVNDSLDSYEALLSDAEDIMISVLTLDLDDDESIQRAKIRNLLRDYRRDVKRLASLIDDLRTRVMETGVDDLRTQVMEIGASETETRLSARESVAVGIGLAILTILGVFVWRLMRP